MIYTKSRHVTLCPVERNCLWRDCGFCSTESPAELRRHVFFHCYHTKLKQLGQQVLSAQPDLSTCSFAYHTRNIIPDIPENFTCLWDECEVSTAKTKCTCSTVSLVDFGRSK